MLWEDGKALGNCLTSPDLRLHSSTHVKFYLDYNLRSASSPVRRAPCAFAKEVDLRFLGGVSLIQFREEQFHCQLLVGEKSRFRCLGWDIGFISFFRAVVYNESQPKNLSWEWLVKIVDFLFFFFLSH